MSPGRCEWCWRLFYREKQRKFFITETIIFLEEKVNTLPLIILSKSNALGAVWEGVREKGDERRIALRVIVISGNEVHHS